MDKELTVNIKDEDEEKTCEKEIVKEFDKYTKKCQSNKNLINLCKMNIVKKLII